ncbi:MAG: C1 family peptidase [Bacteroidales bacterium]|jgi:bleomycin hydrolase|nr:C1 family peptidase [Bacteroidales bacterium]
MKKLFLFIFSALCVLGVQAQSANGGITPEMLSKIKSGYQNTPENKALRNAIVANDINKLAANADNSTAFDDHFSNKVNSKAVTDQKSSGRCWMFTGMNVMRSKAIAKHNLPADFQFSQAYTFFWDQLEKSNLFLQAILDHRVRSMEDKYVEWLFKNPIGDGGQFTGVADLVTKYGLVPKDVMPETFSSNSTSRMSNILSLKLREFGLELRDMANNKSTTEQMLQDRKTEMLKTIYRILVMTIGEPPTEFTWTQRDASGKAVSTDTYTPQSFFKKFVNEDFSKYYMIMNDPTREYYKVYEIEYDRHVYDGKNWVYLNLPMDEIAPIAIASIKDSTMMYFSCDVGKFLDRDKGWLDVNNYDYASLFGTSFNMTKKQRVATFASGSSHAMTLCAVDLDANGKPLKWMVENSWGSSYGHNGFLIMTNEWFNEYMFRVVVEEKYIPAKIKTLIKQKPIMLPPWDPMFAPEE